MATSITQSASQPVVPVTDVRIDGNALDLSVEQLEMKLLPGMHEEVVLTTLLPVADPIAYLDQPITFDWGTPRHRSDFSGYVTKVDKDQVFQQQPATVLTVNGPSWPMSKGRPRHWSGVTTSQIVGELASTHRLSTYLEESSYVWPAYAQMRESDWGLFCALADDMGWIPYTYNGVLRLVDPVKALERGGAVLQLGKSTNQLGDQQLLLDLKPSSQSVIDRSVARPGYAYLGEDGASVKYVNKDTTRFEIDRYVPDSLRASLLEEVIPRVTKYWQASASARCRPIPSLLPGSVVELSTGISQSVKDVNDGLWFVTGVTHLVNRASFTTTVYLVRDRERNTSSSSSPYFWNASRQPAPKVRLQDGKWVATRSVG